MKLNKILVLTMFLVGLSVYAGNDGLWTDMTTVNVQEFRSAMRLYDKEMYSTTKLLYIYSSHVSPQTIVASIYGQTDQKHS